MKNLFKNKKILIALGAVILLAVIITIVVKGKNQSNPELITEEPERRRITEPVNVIPVEERPYVSIRPLADGRNLTISINHLNKPAQKVDYELEYQSGTMLQMVMGMIDLDNLPATKQELLGTCSAGGACTYHENVSGGNLLLRFTDANQDSYVVKSDWRYFDNKDNSEEVASRDAKFQLTADAIANQRYLIVFNSPGYPEDLEGEVIADNFSLSTSTVLSGSGQLTIRTNEESPTAKIVGYDGDEWHEFETTVDGKQAEAEVELMQFYTVAR